MKLNALASKNNNDVQVSPDNFFVTLNSTPTDKNKTNLSTNFQNYTFRNNHNSAWNQRCCMTEDHYDKCSKFIKLDLVERKDADQFEFILQDIGIHCGIPAHLNPKYNKK